MRKVLVCGTRGKFKDYRELVHDYLGGMGEIEIIEGCCPNSADQYAEEFAKNQIYPTAKITHFPGNPGNYLKRNVEMVKACDVVVAFYDGWSYGTAHTIARAVALGKEIQIVTLDKDWVHEK